MEPLRRWKRLGGTLEASHSALCRLSVGDEDRTSESAPAGASAEAKGFCRPARPGASWVAVWFWSRAAWVCGVSAF